MNLLRYNFLLRRTATVLSIAMLTLAITAGTSGIFITFNYQPAAGDAYNSLTYIYESLPNGGLIYSLHNLAGNGIIAVALIQIIILFLSKEFRRSWLTAWISGILLTLATIGLGWTAMILSWNQLGYWRLKVELSIIESIPVAGEFIRNLLTGGGGINTTTVIHFYTLHSYVLSISATALSVIHLIALVVWEQEKNALRQRLEKLVAPISKKLSTKVENASS